MNSARYIVGLAVCLSSMLSAMASQADRSSYVAIPANVKDALSVNCSNCHGEKKQKGQVRFDKADELSEKAILDLLNRVQEQLYLRQMPPDGDALSSAARKLLEEWSRNGVRQLGGVDISDKLRYPDRGNWVDHEMLFSGAIKEKPWSPARRWLVSPQIYMERMFDIFELSPNDRRNAANFTGITNPFVLPDRSGVRYYDLENLDGGHFAAIRSNAEWISGRQLHAARVLAGEMKADEIENPRDKWFPKTTQPEFQKIVLQKSPPTDDELSAAIRKQFQNVLRREPADGESKKYLALTRNAIGLAGNTEGLRQMLMAVLLESEFVYRLEFGSGNADEFGRKKLSPQEASYAITYAFGDRKPDAKLAEAAMQNRLNSKADFEREVKRLLADNTSFQGPADPALESRKKLYSSAHPKTLRFVRDFFGYPLAPKVFKDINRSDGFYQNADRGTSGTSGDLVNEADMLVDWYLQKDKDVFENLLAGEFYFVAPVDDPKTKIKNLNELYEKYKDSDWKKINAGARPKNIPKSLSEEDLKQISAYLGKGSAEKQFAEAMTHVDKFRKKGLEPNPVWSYAFGTHLMKWAYAYSIDPFDWKYECDQPFKLPNREGILMHPAWLIAHSQNSATDPVRRGKWVREKLLAGHVPDVPITVDARIPDDPHHTLRERLEMVSTKAECWKCHEFMNPLGLTFEEFDDFGRFRKVESLEYPENIVEKTKIKYGADTYKTKELNTAGKLSGTGDSKLDGEVKDAVELMSRLQHSTRARQSIIRYAFRYFMGRNEMLSDSQTLIDADKAYVSSGGSFNAVIVSLLTSDSFMYRK